MEYKLRCELFGHSSDVRSLAYSPDGHIISCSRDKTAKLWAVDGSQYFTANTYTGHTNFVSAVCFTPPNEAFPSGLISTGSNDKTICCYSPDSPELLFRLVGHEDTVCCVISSASQNGGLLSSSWDQKAIYWDLLSRMPIALMVGHTQAVWCVLQLKCGLIVTGSADKTIRVYSSDGKFIKSLDGHSDCVRALCAVNDDTFLSTGNDGMIIRWKLPHGIRESEFQGSPNYIYSLDYNPAQEMTVWCGESQSVYLKIKDSLTSVKVPALSIWAIAILPNSDIAVGCSDGVVRIFTSNPLFYAADCVIKEHESQVMKVSDTNKKEQASKSVKPYLNDLSGPEILSIEGRHYDDIRVVREGVLAVLYSWSNGQWNLVGFKRGSYLGKINKKTYKGKEYDYLFNIDIEEGQPNVVLPMNLQEDPWDVASEFVMKRSLPHAYLQQIVDFIIKNVKDDFINSGGNQVTLGLEGFSEDNEVLNRYFPQKQFIGFETANINGIFTKLNEFNGKLGGVFNESSFEELKKLTKSGEEMEPSVLTLVSLTDWPEDCLFPVLDLIRVTVRNPRVNSLLFEGKNSNLFKKLMKLLERGQLANNQLMTLRILSNMLKSDPGRQIVLDRAETLLEKGSELCSSDCGPALQVAVATLILNLTVSSSDNLSLRPKCSRCLENLLGKLNDKEAAFRGLVAVGSLISYSGTSIISPVLKTLLFELDKNINLSQSHAENCLKEILSIIR